MSGGPGLERARRFPMRRGVRGLVRHLLGWGFLALGVVGLVLPVIQGVLFIAVGLLLLAPDIPAFARLLGWAENRFPRLRPMIRKARSRVGGAQPPPGPAPGDR